MALIAARAKLTYGDDKVVSRTSESLNVNLPRPIWDFIIRVEYSPLAGSTNEYLHFELDEIAIIPPNKFCSIYPIPRDEINLTQTPAGLHPASFLFNDTLFNGRSVKTIGLYETVGTYRFSSPTVLNIPHILTDIAPFGTQVADLVFKHAYAGDVKCKIGGQLAPTFTIPGANIVAGDTWNSKPEWGNKSASLAVNSGTYTNVGKTITLNNVVFSLLHQYRSGDNVNKMIERGSKGLENFTDSRFDIYSSVDVTITPSTGESFTYNLVREGVSDWYYVYSVLLDFYDVPLKQFYNFLWVHRGKAATITLAFKV